MMGPSDVQDHLAYDSAESLFPLPEVADIFDGVTSLSPEDRAIIEKNNNLNMKMFEGYQESVKKAYVDLFDSSAEGFLHMKNLLTFFFLLAGHNDAVILEDARQKLAPMFNSVVQRHLSQNLDNRSGSDDVHRNSSGLFGGKGWPIIIYHN